ncbi:hypothetical protein K933_08552 [Candidatus Halobonum tyrrellensis G22]|uniref:DUF4349 domain-containing protein n=1 Tax=Candidatus Halobonum tyrrellensis G22 TaxID=1324957 RepID=V4GTQ2_9EURY|nr:hypothetical protein K933_08552 [Candidatus Halobonum tyrrellensis G22]
MCCVLLLVLAGCSGGGDGAGGGVAQRGGSEDLAATATAAPEDTAAADATGAGGEEGTAGDATGAQVQRQDRQLIRTATVRLRVDDYEAARANLTELAASTGGYVSESTENVNGEGNRTWTEGRVVLRVPAGNYSGAMEAVTAQGEVVSRTEGTQDVTEQVVDLQARLDSLEAERDRLRELYQRANDTEEVLAVQRELSDVQTEIERVEARLQSLQRRVTYSTITVELFEPSPDYEPPETSAWYDTPLVEAFLSSIDGVVVLARSAVVLTAYALPYAIAVGVPLTLLALLYRRRADLV